MPGLPLNGPAEPHLKPCDSCIRSRTLPTEDAFATFVVEGVLPIAGANPGRLPDVDAADWRDDAGAEIHPEEGIAAVVSDLLNLDPTSLLAAYGYWALLLLVAAESMGIPLPGETMLVVASVYAGTTHRLHIALVVLAAAAGAILGDNLGFLVGREGGSRLLRRFGRYVRLNEEKLRLGQYLFERHGGKVIFFGRFLPVLRIWAAFLAGANRMRWRRFLAFNAAGGSVWATVMGLGAYALGDGASQLGSSVGLGMVALAMSAMVGIAIALRRSERRWRAEANRALASRARC